MVGFDTQKPGPTSGCRRWHPTESGSGRASGPGEVRVPGALSSVGLAVVEYCRFLVPRAKERTLMGTMQLELSRMKV